jgi:hypothetical protein
VAVQRVLRDTRAQPAVTFYVGTTPTSADGVVTVDIFRGDGSIFATDAATTGPAPTGTYTYTLAPQSTLERFQLVWEGTFGGVVQRQTSFVEVVGGYAVSLADLQAESGLSTKTPAQLAEARQWFEDRAEDFCGVAFVPRYEREVLDGDGSRKLDLKHARPRAIISAKFDGVAQTTTTWDLYDAGFIVAPLAFPRGFHNVEIIYEHGYDSAPSDIHDAALTAIRSNVLADTSGGGGIPSGVTSLITDAGTMVFGGRLTRPFGIRAVDDVLLDRREVMLA